MDHYKLNLPRTLVLVLLICAAESACHNHGGAATKTKGMHAKAAVSVGEGHRKKVEDKPRDMEKTVAAQPHVQPTDAAEAPAVCAGCGDNQKSDSFASNLWSGFGQPADNAFERKEDAQLLKMLNKRRAQDFVSFLFAAKFSEPASQQKDALSKLLVDAAYARFDDDVIVHQYLLGVVPLISVNPQQSPVRRSKAKASEQNHKAYGLYLFDAALAAELSKLCGKPFSAVGLKETAQQLRASFCYFEALSNATGDYGVASQLMDHGQQIDRLISRQKQAAKSKGADLPSWVEFAPEQDHVGVLATAFPSEDLASVEGIFRLQDDRRLYSLVSYTIARIAEVNPAVSPMRQAVLAASLSQISLSVLQTDEDNRAFIDLLADVSAFRASTRGLGLGGLSVSLGNVAAEACGLNYSVGEQDLNAGQSGLLLSACLFRATLHRFGGDAEMAAAAYKSLVARGQPTAELYARPVTQDYSLSSWTEVTRPIPIVAAEGHVEALVEALAKIVHSPLQGTLRGHTTFPLLARIAQAIYPGDEAAQENWLIVLAMESKFDGEPTSETGARGIGQLIPTYARDFGEGCGLTQVDAVDLADDATNALLSACYLKSLVEAHEGMVMLALAAYNAGLNSNDLVHFKHLSRMSNEPANYVARFALIKESLDRRLEKDKLAVKVATDRPASARDSRIEIASAAPALSPAAGSLANDPAAVGEGSPREEQPSLVH